MACMAKCCKPIIGDRVVGYITQGRGVTVHRENCRQFLRMKDQSPDRVIVVEWGNFIKQRFIADLRVIALQNQPTLKDITAILATEKVNIVGVRAFPHRKNQVDEIQLSIEVQNSEQLDLLRRQIAKIDSVMEVVRL